MKYSKRFLIILSILVIHSCHGQGNSNSSHKVQIRSDKSNGNSFALSYSDEALLKGFVNTEDSSNDPALQITDYISSLIQDKQGNFWFGTMGRGVIRYKQKNLEYLRSDQGFEADVVKDIKEAEDGTIWFASTEGLIKYNAKKFTKFTEKDGLPYKDINCLEIDKKGRLWIGTKKGLFQFDGYQFTTIHLEMENYKNKAIIINDLHEDRHGQMWIGTNNGVYFYHPSKKAKPQKHLLIESSLSNTVINSILEDHLGQIWLATQNEGVCYWDGSGITQIETERGHQGKWTGRGLFEDSSGNIWFTIDGVSTYQYNGNTAIKVFQRQSCISHTLRSAMEDDMGRIWFGGWLGLHRYDP